MAEQGFSQIESVASVLSESGILAKADRLFIVVNASLRRSLCSISEAKLQMTPNHTDRKIDVFFYGLFMDEALLRNKGFDPTNPRQARLDNFQLLIGERATLMPSTGQVAHGFLFSLTHEEVRRLYDEPSVAAYRPEAVLAQLEDGQGIPALCFNLPLGSPGERNREYAAKLKELAIRLQLPSSYVETI